MSNVKKILFFVFSFLLFTCQVEAAVNGCIKGQLSSRLNPNLKPIDLCFDNSAPEPGSENPLPPELPKEQALVKNGASLKIYQQLLDKLMNRFIPSMGGDFTVRIDALDINLGVLGMRVESRDSSAILKLTPKSRSRLSLVAQETNTLKARFYVDMEADINLAFVVKAEDGSESVESGHVHIEGLAVQMLLNYDIQNQQLIFKTDSSIVSGFDKVSFSGMDRVVRLASDILGVSVNVESLISNNLPQILKKHFGASLLPQLNDKLSAYLKLTNYDYCKESGLQAEEKNIYCGLLIGMQQQSVSTDKNGILVSLNTLLAMNKDTLPACSEVYWPPQNQCDDEVWDEQQNAPAAPVFKNDVGADAAFSLSLAQIKQALYAVWRTGKLNIQQSINIYDLVSSFFPSWPVAQQVQASLKIGHVPDVRLDADKQQIYVKIPHVLAVLKAPLETTTQPLFDISVEADIEAIAAIGIAPAYVSGRANPLGGQLSFQLQSLDVQYARLTSGPSVSELSEHERQLFIHQLLFPALRDLIAGLPLPSAVFRFGLSDPYQRMGVRLLDYDLASDALTAYVNIDISAFDDIQKPYLIAKSLQFSVNGQVFETPVSVSSLPVVGNSDFSVLFDKYDTYPQDLSDYVSVSAWIDGEESLFRAYERAYPVMQLKDGQHQIQLIAQDLRGNVFDPRVDESPRALASLQLAVDTATPDTRIVESPRMYSQNVSPVFVLATQTRLDKAVISDFSATLIDSQQRVVWQKEQQVGGRFVLPVLGEGIYEFRARARNIFNRQDPTGVAQGFVVDLTPPILDVSRIRFPQKGQIVNPVLSPFDVLAQDNLSPDSLLQYSYMITDVGHHCLEQFSGFSPGSSIRVTGCDFKDGVYQFYVRAMDAAGNITQMPAVVDFIVDATAPEVFFIETPDKKVNTHTVQFKMGAKDAATSGRLMGNQLVYWYRLTSREYAYESRVLDDTLILDNLPSAQDYELTVIVQDAAGNKSLPVRYQFALDAVSPHTQVLSSIPAYLTSDSFDVQFKATDDLSLPSQLQVWMQFDESPAIQLDGQDSHYLWPSLKEGVHRCSIYAQDAFGNKEQTQHFSFIVDRTPPRTYLDKSVSVQHVKQGVWTPLVYALDNLTAQDNMRYVYRLKYSDQNEREWSLPVSLEQLNVDLDTLGEAYLEIAAVDEAGLQDPQGVKLPLLVTANQKNSGCQTQSVHTELIALMFLLWGCWRRCQSVLNF